LKAESALEQPSPSISRQISSLINNEYCNRFVD
jgi:hypothetical protein